MLHTTATATLAKFSSHTIIYFFVESETALLAGEREERANHKLFIDVPVVSLVTSFVISMENDRKSETSVY